MAKRTELVQIINAPAVFPGPANVNFSFNAFSLLIVNEAVAPTAVAFISFDGVTDDCKLVPGTPSAGLRLERQVNTLWIRGVNTPNVSVIAED